MMKIRILKCFTQLKNEMSRKKFSSSFNFSSKHKFKFGAVKVPHFSKKDKGGEDAYAAAEEMICVADGVGGWNDHGVDPSKYSNELCQNVKQQYTKNYLKYHSTPKNIFIDAAKLTKSIGSSTFCMLTLDLEKRYLHSVNLGDSGYMIVRRNGEHHSVIFKSEEQQHSFNFPFQVGTEGDKPESAITNTHEYQEKDLVILGTDGVWDNVFDQQMIALINRFYAVAPDKEDLNNLAKFIAETTEQISLDERYQSPFCKRSGGLYLGGKPDDVTVVVAQIVKRE